MDEDERRRVEFAARFGVNPEFVDLSLMAPTSAPEKKSERTVTPPTEQELEALAERLGLDPRHIKGGSNE